MPIPLDDLRWALLHHAYGVASDVPEMLRALAGGDDRIWSEIYSALCHQGDVDTATFAALPHIVAIGASRPRAEQTTFWVFAGDVARSRDQGPVPPDIEADLQSALREAEERAAACVVDGVDEGDATSLVGALASLRGGWAVARAIEGLRGQELTPQCPACERLLYVSLAEPPFVAEDEDPVGKKKGRRSTVTARGPRPELAALARMAHDARLAPLARKLDALDCDVTCPSCGHVFSLLDTTT